MLDSNVQVQKQQLRSEFLEKACANLFRLDIVFRPVPPSYNQMMIIFSSVDGGDRERAVINVTELEQALTQAGLATDFWLSLAGRSWQGIIHSLAVQADGYLMALELTDLILFLPFEERSNGNPHLMVHLLSESEVEGDIFNTNAGLSKSSVSSTSSSSTKSQSDERVTRSSSQNSEEPHPAEPKYSGFWLKSEELYQRVEPTIDFDYNEEPTVVVPVAKILARLEEERQALKRSQEGIEEEIPVIVPDLPKSILQQSDLMVEIVGFRSLRKLDANAFKRSLSTAAQCDPKDIHLKAIASTEQEVLILIELPTKPAMEQLLAFSSKHQSLKARILVTAFDALSTDRQAAWLNFLDNQSILDTQDLIMVTNPWPLPKG